MRALLAGFAALALMCPISPAPLCEEPPETRTIPWLEWSDEAFNKAVEEGKPILLYVRAEWSRSTLWIDDNVYSDPEVIRLLGEKWVPIRVNRDRRPDVDLRYQVAVNVASRGEAGWPLTAVLLDNGEIVYGKSFIPLEDRRGQVGMRTLLERTERLIRNNPGATEGTQRIIEMTFNREKQRFRPAEISTGVIDEIARTTMEVNDPEFGGFGAPPRTPTPFILELISTLYHRTKDTGYLEALTRTLDGMSRGAIYDRLGGGFHRTVTDHAWRMPVFEKMLTYNSTLMTNYLAGYEITGNVEYREVAEKTLDYLLGTLQAPGGGFYVAQAAVTRGDDPKGYYYAWGAADFGKAVPAGLESIAGLLFNVTEEGDVPLGPPPRSLLYTVIGTEEAAAALEIEPDELRSRKRNLLAALKEARSSRTAPPVVKDIYVDSCAEAALGMLEAGRVLGRLDARAAGLRAVDRMLASMADGRQLLHRLEPSPQDGVDPPLALDHLMLARAAVSAFETTGDRKYLDAAEEVIQRAITLFWDEDGGGFYDVAGGTRVKGYLRNRRKLPNDIAYPAMNTIAARVLDRLEIHTGKEAYRKRAEGCLKDLIASRDTLDHRNAGLALAVEAHLNPPTRYLVVGGKDAAETGELLAAARRIFDPGKVVRVLDPADDGKAIKALDLPSRDEPYVVACHGESCSEPVTDVAALPRADNPL